MPQAPHAKFSQAGHPSLRQMLGPERVMALGKTLALLDLKLAETSPGPLQSQLLERRGRVESMLHRARVALGQGVPREVP